MYVVGAPRVTSLSSYCLYVGSPKKRATSSMYFHKASLKFRYNKNKPISQYKNIRIQEYLHKYITRH
jgi:hypothetical protein